MLELNKNDLQSSIVLTLELATKPYFIFAFTHVLTKEKVTFVSDQDVSLFPYRYNEFILNTMELFGTKNNGEWHYVIYQSDIPDSSVQDDPLEYGKMILSQNETFAFVKYEDTPITYKSYGN